MVVVVGGVTLRLIEKADLPHFEQASPSAGLHWQTAGTEQLR